MAEGKLNPRELARLEEQKKKKKARVKYILGGAALLLLIALVAFVNSSLFTDGLAALKVGDESFTVADVNYEYQKCYMQFSQSYGDYISMFMDTSLPLDQQDCPFESDGGTWDDYFKKTAENNLKETAVFRKAAREAGYTLTEDEQADIDSSISMYSMYASLYGYSLDGYLAANYGSGNNEKTVRRHMEEEAVINRYLQDLYESFTFTDEEKDAYYDENADSFDRVELLYAYVTDSDDKDARQIAEDIVAQTADGGEQAFRDAVLELTGSEATETSYSFTSFLSQYGDSITREEVAEGAVFTHNTDTAGYAVYILGVEDNRYPTVSVRHILIKAVDEDEDGEYSDEEKAAALAKVEEIRDEWLSGAADEDSFAVLADLRSEDQGSNTNGGLYEGIYKGQMVDEFDAFCFDDHQHGDYDIVYGEASSYAGYHLIYFVGADGELYSRTMAEDALRSDKYGEETAAMTEGVESQRTFMWRYVMHGN